MGNVGRRLVEVSLVFAQFGLVCAYIAFIVPSMDGIIKTCTTPPYELNPAVFGFVLLVIYTPLCWIRKIEILAPTHIFADIMIVVTLVTLCIYAGMYIQEHGFAKDVPAIKGDTFLDAIGSSVYAYEGIGVVLPIYEVTKKPENMNKNLVAVMTVVLAIYLIFGYLMLFAYGKLLGDSPLITETVTNAEAADHKGQKFIDYVILVIKVFFSFNLIFSYPLVIFPANAVIEENLYRDWPKSERRKWFKNLNRFIMVLVTIVFSISIAKQLDKFLAVLGALGCTPITFTLPTLFHIYLCKPTGRELMLDWFVVGVSMVILVFCTFYSIYVWSVATE